MIILCFVVLVPLVDIVIACDWQISNDTVTIFVDKAMSNLTGVTRSEKFDGINGNFKSQEIRLDGQCLQLDEDLMSSSFKIHHHGGFECFMFRETNCEGVAELLTGGEIIHFDVNMTHVMCEKCRTFWSKLKSFFGWNRTFLSFGWHRFCERVFVIQMNSCEMNVAYLFM